MNKKFGLLVFLVLFLLSHAVLRAEIGIKAGGLMSFAGNSSAVYNASNRFAARGGVFWSLGIGPVSIRSGIDLARKGARYYSAITRASQILDLDYIVLPLLLNIHIPGTPADVFAGPYGAFLLRSTKRDRENFWTDEDNKVSRLDYGLEAGIRYRIFKVFMVEFQFEYGLAKVVYTPGKPDWRIHRNRTLSLLFGLRI
jgi:hypothetical protein